MGDERNVRFGLIIGVTFEPLRGNFQTFMLFPLKKMLRLQIVGVIQVKFGTWILDVDSSIERWGVALVQQLNSWVADGNRDHLSWKIDPSWKFS